MVHYVLWSVSAEGCRISHEYSLLLANAGDDKDDFVDMYKAECSNVPYDQDKGLIAVWPQDLRGAVTYCLYMSTGRDCKCTTRTQTVDPKGKKWIVPVGKHSGC